MIYYILLFKFLRFFRTLSPRQENYLAHCQISLSSGATNYCWDSTVTARRCVSLLFRACTGHRQFHGHSGVRKTDLCELLTHTQTHESVYVRRISLGCCIIIPWNNNQSADKNCFVACDLLFAAAGIESSESSWNHETRNFHDSSRKAFRSSQIIWRLPTTSCSPITWNEMCQNGEFSPDQILGARLLAVSNDDE